MNLLELPKWPERKDSVENQLADLRLIANRIGFFAAADAISQWCQNMPVLKYGCHCDLEPHMEPDECVIDDGRFQDCIYAEKGMRKEQCEYWKIIA